MHLDDMLRWSTTYTHMIDLGHMLDKACVDIEEASVVTGILGSN